MLRDRLMVGQRPLEPSVLVRIQVPQIWFGTFESSRPNLGAKDLHRSHNYSFPGLQVLKAFLMVFYFTIRSGSHWNVVTGIIQVPY